MATNGSIDITSANATLTLTVDSVFPSGITVQQFATDRAYNADNQDITEVRIGVDGKIAAGYTPNIFQVTISLEANSPSYEDFAQIATAMRVNKKPYKCGLVAEVTSIGKRFTWSTGVLKNCPLVMSAGRVLEPTQWTFNFQDLEVASI